MSTHHITMKRSADQPCPEIRQMEDNRPVPASTTSFSAVNQLELKTRAEFVQDYRHLTLDPNTAYRELSLSQGNRSVELKKLVQDYPYRPERFTHLWQVLCKEHLSERSYWEVEWTGSIEIAVCYEDIGRSDYFHECAFGCNENSWSLDLNENNSCFRHNDVEISLPKPQSSSRRVPGSQRRCSGLLQCFRRHFEPHPQSPDHFHSAPLPWVVGCRPR